MTPPDVCFKTFLLVEQSGSQEGGGDRWVRGVGRILQDCRVWELRGRVRNSPGVPAGTAGRPRTGDGRGKDLVKEAGELWVGQDA